MKPLIVLVHIPKTGGTSLRVAAEHYFGPKRMLYDYGTGAKLTSDLVRKWVYDQKDLEGFARVAAENGFCFLSGHFHLDKYFGVIPGARFVSWIRQPVARIWSAYRHFSMHLGFDGSFQEFYSTPRFQNQQSRFLGKQLDQLEFIGITERFGASLRRFNRQFEVKFKQHRSNTTPTSDVSGVPGPKDLEAIAALNQEDMQLYHAIEKNFLGQA